MKEESLNQIQDFIENESFVRWVRSEADSAEDYWDRFLADHPEKEELIAQAKLIVSGIPMQPEKIRTEQVEMALTKLNNRIDNLNPIVKHYSRWWWAVASVIIMLSSVGIWWYNNHHLMVRYVTGFGEWKTIELPDGSIVNLNADSELKFAKKWRDREVRKVWLQGEAFFQVVKMLDLDTEFRVITSDLDVEVLGTSFNVRTRGDQTEVYLEEGKVKLNLGEQITYMEPGDLISYSSRQERVIDRRRADVNVPAPSAWNEGVIEMTNAYAFDIFKKLEEIYGVKIRVRNEEVYSKEYWVQLPMQELDIVIPILEKSMKVTILKKGNLLVIE